MQTPPVSPERLDAISRMLPEKRIVVIGDLMLDRYLWGSVERISPEAPVPVVKVERESVLLGGAANVLANLSAVGCVPVCVGTVGTDGYGRKALALLERHGISTEHIVRMPDRPTTVKTRVVAHEQHVVRVDRENDALPVPETVSALKQTVSSVLETADAVIISDYGKGTINETVLDTVRDVCRSNNLFCAIDPKERNFPFYHGFSLITPNNREAERAVGYPLNDTESLVRAGTALLDTYGLEYCLITRGSRGMALFCAADRSHTVLPTFAREVYDVTGAGDTVISVFTAVFAAGASAVEAAVIANHAAGLVVAEVGTVTADWQRISSDILTRTPRQEP